MSEHEQIYKQLFGSKPTIDDEVNELKRDIINDMCEYKQMESAYVPANVTVDNVSVSCGDVVLAAKIATVLSYNDESPILVILSRLNEYCNVVRD